MANSSSDWLTALLERPQESGGGVKTLDWLPDFSEPREGFVEGLPSARPEEPALPAEPHHTAERVPDDPLVDLLREALGEEARVFEESAAPVPEPELQAEPERESDPVPEPEPEIDPIAEAFEQGKLAGREAILAEQEAEAEAEAGRKLQLRQTFRALDQAAMDALAGELAETVIALCAQSLADFIPAPDALKGRCLQAAQRLGSGAGEATLYLHPDDLALLDASGLEGWRLVGDPAAERGGLRLETQGGMVSDRPEDWRRAIAAALKG